MKKIESKNVKIAVTVVLAAAILYVIMSIIDNIGLVFESVSSAISFVLRILRPVVIGFVFTLLLYRPSAFAARLLCRTRFFSQHKRGAAVLGVLIVFMIFLVLIAVFLYLMIPSVIQSVSSITRDLPQYGKKLDILLTQLTQSVEVKGVLEFIGIDAASSSSTSALISQFWSEITSVLQGVTEFLFGFIVNTGLFLYNFVLGLFFAVYMLIFKDQIKAQLACISKAISKKAHYKLAFIMKVSDDMFYRFIAGKGLCSIAVGIATFLACTIIGFKYTPLISLIIMITNMVPTFGPLIGAIPATLLAMMTAPIYGIYMLIIVIILQIIDGNILGPRVLGDSLGINGFWIIFSIVVMGALLGVFGMLIAAPLFGLIRILIKNWMYKRQNDYIQEDAQAEYKKSLDRYNKWSEKEA